MDRISLAKKIGRDNIDKVVDDFYNQIQTHPTLAKPFSIVGHWKEHKERIAEFWWVALGGKPTANFSYDPVGKHYSAGFTADLLTDWKNLFFEVSKSHLSIDLANAWQDRVELIGENLVRQNARLIKQHQSPTQTD